MTSEAMLLSPLPRRVHDPLRSWCTSPSSCFADDSALTMERPFWYEINTSTSEVYEEHAYTGGAKLLPEWTPAFVFRPQSHASTSAGPSSPELDSSNGPLNCGSPAFSPVGGCSVLSRSKFQDSPPLSQPIENKEAREKTLARKVFVGGIPQRVDQLELYKMFSRVAKVKKAWLQTSQDRCANNAKKHRGFGFVIFSDSNAVEHLLGEDTSKFITLEEGLRFEIKRAIGKFAGVPPTPDKCQTPHGTPSKKKDTGTPLRQDQCGPQGISAEFSPALCRSLTYEEMPKVPSFPSVCCLHREVASGLPKTPTAHLPQAFVPKQVVTQPVMCSPPPSMLMDFLVGGGHRPQTDLELESLLVRAMPEHYDD